jgi:hypothetical protein
MDGREAICFSLVRMRRTVIVLLLVCGLCTGTRSTRVGVLVGHNPDACKGVGSSVDEVLCNLKEYEAAIKVAATQGVQLLVLPEGCV